MLGKWKQSVLLTCKPFLYKTLIYVCPQGIYNMSDCIHLHTLCFKQILVCIYIYICTHGVNKPQRITDMWQYTSSFYPNKQDGTCGNTTLHCKCPLCIDYRKPAKTLKQEIQTRIRGDFRCGLNWIAPDGNPALCDGESKDRHCCSAEGWCGNTTAHCTCMYVLSAIFFVCCIWMRVNILFQTSERHVCVRAHL